MKTALSCLLLTALFATACKREKSPSPYTRLAYDETHCSDPWYPDIIDKTALQISLRTWLDEKKDIQAHAIDIQRTGPEASYLSCNSKNGREITISISPGDVQKAEELGFRKK